MKFSYLLLFPLAMFVLFSCGDDPATPDNDPPVAVAGLDITMKLGSAANLNGSGSTDPEGQPLAFLWTITQRPAESVCTFTSGNTNATASFVPDKTGTYVVSLVVNDGTQDSTADTLTITVNEQDPDLTPVAVGSLDTSVLQGDPLSVMAQISNAFLGASGIFRTGVYLSTDATITTGDVFLGYVTSGSLTSNQAAAFSTNLTVPPATAPGIYYIGVIADYEGLIAEESEANNSLASSTTITVVKRTVDLVPSAVTRASNTIFQGETMNMTCRITNTGNTASGAFRAGLYLSSDTTITTGDTFLGYVGVSSLAANGSVSISTNVTIGPSQTPGTYYVGVIADYQGAVTEESEANNTAYAASSVTVQARTRNIVMQSATLPAAGVSGSTVSVPYTVTNSGNTATGTFRVGVYISDDATVTSADTLIGSTTLSLAASGTSSGSISATIPVNTSKKSYYIGIIADDQAAVTETNETDNTSSQTVALTPQKVDWVVMVYIAADNSLSAAAATDLAEMRAAGLNGNKVRVVTLVDQEGANNTYLYEVISGQSRQLASTELGLNATGTGELDTGNPATLQHFIQYVTNNYAATNYQLVIWNHGDGWRSSRPKKTGQFKFFTSGNRLTINPGQSSLSKDANKVLVKGICEDATSGSYLYNNDVQTVVTGAGIKLLSMDACLMGMVETAYEMRKSVTGIDYITFSQNNIPSQGYPYTTILNHYLAASDTSALNFANIVVTDYVASYSSTPSVTLSAVDLSKIEAVVTALGSFTTYLSSQSQATLDSTRAACQSFDVAYHIDLWDYANRFADASATTLKSAIEDAVVANAHGTSFPNAHGLALYFPIPTDPDYIDTNNTHNLDFLTDSGWDNFLATKTFGLTIDTAEPGNDDPFGLMATKFIYTGYIMSYSDVDWYTITVTAGGSLNISLSSVPANCDIDVELYNGSGSFVAGSNSGSYGQSEYISVTATAQTYFIIVYPYDGFSLSDSYYLNLYGTATY